MRSLVRLISRYLLLVILASVLAPGFAGEIARGTAQGAHQHQAMAEMAVVDHEAGHEMHCATDQDSQGSTPSCCADSLHQCCPGHQLGHVRALELPELLPGAPLVVAMAASEAFLTRVPEGLERPPRSLSV